MAHPHHRRKSMAGFANPATLGVTRQGNDIKFDLEMVKEQALEDLGTQPTAKFRRFCRSEHTDELLRQLILYFITRVQWQGFEQISVKAKTMNEWSKIDTARQAVGGRGQEAFKAEMLENLRCIGPLYARILLQHSSFSSLHKDRVFFETLYEFLRRVIEFCFSFIQNLGTTIETELGRIFRTGFFNLSVRKARGPSLVDELSVRRLYEMRHSVDQSELTTDMIASLYDRPRPSGLQDSYVATSGLISGLLRRTHVGRGVNTDRHVARTAVDIGMEPLAVVSASKKSREVAGANISELQELEWLRKELGGTSDHAVHEAVSRAATTVPAGGRPSVALGGAGGSAVARMVVGTAGAELSQELPASARPVLPQNSPSPPPEEEDPSGSGRPLSDQRRVSSPRPATGKKEGRTVGFAE
ncbi:unnamed protein product [Pedinophyceae sp. YPF-701]|nr:unnamed protein product [Pedinophyceae sp. YPF-701]